MKIKTRLKQIAENPFVNITAGIVLMVSTLNETFPNLSEIFRISWLEMHHGVGFYGVWHILQALPDCLDSIERIFR